MLQVTFAEIQQAASTISSSATQVDGQLDELRSEVVKTMSGYSGDAAAAYQAAQQKWDEAAADLQKVLAAIGVAVGQAGEAYESAEKKNLSRW
ncbi:WXG100 family type VII secretion target [Lentzea sp. BCCO 10_0798]|uniref:ESAT-6-like protein n=1 Tax=Lentzea kristufekii TaxID=3095430 RepID=A0ABU4TV00_9PSEU|nr:WXG100 family type VII secretion target [Lentzea sp. BCCO 10_0798]MDX8052135.1 WXG100 family type VII secretion target [Lentzea sp. BCCO 10_0798]